MTDEAERANFGCDTAEHAEQGYSLTMLWIVVAVSLGTWGLIRWLTT